MSTSKELNFSIDAFVKMKRLRFLKICDLLIDRSLEYLSEKELITYPHDVWTRREYLYNKVHLYGDTKFLSNNLSRLYWHGYPLKSLPSNFHPEKLVELNMCFSRLKQLWEGKKHDCNLYAFFSLNRSYNPLNKYPFFSLL